MDQPTRLNDRARQLAALSANWSDLHARAEAILVRTTSSEFRIAVVGEFKRGKSTLLNALLHRKLLPTGVLPVTAVPIEIAAGEEAAEVVFEDGRHQPIALSEVARFTTEAENADNRLGVMQVNLTVRSDLLQGGLTLVDVPGMGSIHEGATETAKSTYQTVDGAVLVLSMDSPLSASERREAQDIVARDAHLFVVVNKSDHFNDQIAEVRRFVSEQLGQPNETVYCLSAQAALHGELDQAGDFAAFENAVRDFVADGLARTRDALLERELTLIANAASERATLELLAGELDLDELDAKVATLGAAIAEERLRHDSDRRSIATEVATIGAEVRSRLLDAAGDAYEARRTDVVDDLLLDATVQAARRAVTQHVESIVRAELSRIWSENATWLDADWRRLADRHAVETERRLGAVRSAAAELFAVELSLAPPPIVERTPDENLYYFPPPMSMTEGLIDPLRRLIPASAMRHKVESDALEMLRRELAKHAGRAGAALQERLEVTWRAFDQAMRHYLDDAVGAIEVALDRAVRLRDDTDVEIEARRATLARIVSDLRAIDSGK